MPRRVCVRSSINVDEFFEVDHIVRPGETISSNGYSKRPGGKGANVATAIAKASSRPDTVHFCGTIGEQDEWLRDTLVSNGVGAEPATLVASKQLPTGRAIIQLSAHDADNSIVLFPGANHAPSSLPLALASKYSHMLCQNEIPPAQTSEALTVAKVHGLTTIFNPSPVPTRAAFYAVPWDQIDWLIVNQEEAYSLAHKFAEDDMHASTDAGGAKSEGEEPLDSLPRYLPKATGIVMTMGAQGVQMVLRETLAPDEAGRTAGSGKLTKLSAKAGKAHGKIINTTGAGDTFAGYLAACLLRLHGPIPTADEMQVILTVACEAATATCEKDGALEAMPKVEEVKRRLGDDFVWPAFM